MKHLHRRHRLQSDRRAISGAVTAVMLLLIITSVLSITVAIYVPVWGEAGEADHMRVTLEQFYSLRENIDAQVLRDSPVTASTQITLGNAPSALMGFSKTTGRVAVNPFQGNLTVHNLTDINDTYARSRGNVTFSSQNAYQPQQTYIYEAGAILVAGSADAAMRVPPHFGVVKDPDGNITASMTFISITGDFSSFSGTENVIIESRLLSRDRTVYEGADWALGKDLSLNISTQYPNAWKRYFNETLGRTTSLLSEGTDYSISSGTGYVRVDLRAVTVLNLGVAMVEVRIK